MTPSESDQDSPRMLAGSSRRLYYQSDSGTESYTESMSIRSAASGSESVSSICHKSLCKPSTLAEATYNFCTYLPFHISPFPSSSTSSLLPPSPSIIMLSSLSAMPEGHISHHVSMSSMTSSMTAASTSWYTGSSTGSSAFVKGLYNVHMVRITCFRAYCMLMIYPSSLIGYASVNFLLSEVPDSVRTIKLAVPLALLCATVVYLFINVSYFAVVSKTSPGGITIRKMHETKY